MYKGTATCIDNKQARHPSKTTSSRCPFTKPERRSSWQATRYPNLQEPKQRGTNKMPFVFGPLLDTILERRDPLILHCWHEKGLNSGGAPIRRETQPFGPWFRHATCLFPSTQHPRSTKLWVMSNWWQHPASNRLLYQAETTSVEAPLQLGPLKLASSWRKVSASSDPSPNQASPTRGLCCERLQRRNRP